jgi:peptide/nickel transport system ATP-binding protein
MFRGNIIETGPASEVLDSPRHPYTQLLRESIPEADPDKRWQSTVTLSSDETSDFQRTGCKFAPRCPKVMQRCRVEMPPEYQRGTVAVRCFLYAEGDEPPARE